MDGQIRKWVIGGCLIVLLAGTQYLTGCTVVETVLGEDRPSASISGVRFADLSTEDVSLEFDVNVNNPYPLALPLLNTTYSLASGEESFMNGQADLQGSVPAGGSRTVTVPARVNFMRLLDAVKGVRPGQVVPYAAQIDLGIDVPGLGEQTLPVRKEGELPVPTTPKVDVNNIKWDRLSIQEARGSVDLAIGNTNEFPIGLKTFDYRLELGGTEVAQSVIDQGLELKPGGTGNLKIPLSISPTKLGLAVLNILRGDEAGYRIRGNMEASTPFAPITLPLDSSGKTRIEH